MNDDNKQERRRDPAGQDKAESGGSGGGSVDKIRDILFGSQMKEYDKKFSRLEELLLKKVSNIRDETVKRVDSLELFIKKEVESLDRRLRTEKADRSEKEKEFSGGLEEIAKSLEKKIAQLSEFTGRGEKELRQQILEQSKTLRDEIRQMSEEMAISLERAVEELRNDKIDNTTLSNLLTEMAMRLGDDPALSKLGKLGRE